MVDAKERDENEEKSATNEREIIVIRRDVFAMLVPSGARVMLHQGTEVTITQALGTFFTVNVYGNLARIDGKDADAIGKAPVVAVATLPEGATLEDHVWAQLRTVFDPEIPVNIVELGLIYRCELEPLGDNQFKVFIEMTLTAPGCGMGPAIVEDVERKVTALPAVKAVEVELVFDPPWDQSMMSDVAKLELGLL